MNAQDSLHHLIQDWAKQQIQEQPTPLTPALLRCKARLAREDARQLRLRRIQAGILVLPILLILALGLGQLSGLLQLLFGLSPAALGSLLALAGLGALITPALAAE